jgi:branched-subunit amino acid ABC-type transport system permease component
LCTMPPFGSVSALAPPSPPPLAPPRMDKLLQTMMDALAVGSLYALIALGYTMVYGILKFINFAHSDVFVLGAWVSFSTALSVGFADARPSTPEFDLAPIAMWVRLAVGGLVAAAALATLYERVVAKGRARTAVSGSLLLVASWACALLGLVIVTRWLKATPGLAMLSGGLILVIAMGTCGLVGFSLERLAYKPLRKAPRLNVLITAIGVSLLLQNTGQLPWMFGTRPESMPTLLEDRVLNRTVLSHGPLTVYGGTEVTLQTAVTIEAGRTHTLEVRQAESGRISTVGVSSAPGTYEAGQMLSVVPAINSTGGESYKFIRAPRVPVRLLDVIGAGTAVILMLVLDWLVFRTKLGRAMRAVSFNPRNAALMGIDVDRVISFTFVLGAALAAAAGFLISQKYSGLNQTASAIWVLLGLKAFVAAVVGGIGNIRGAMLGGLLIGLLEFFVRAYVPDGTKLCDVFVFGLLVVILLFRPSGILGKTVAEKV